jgi:hypothetical protein
MREEVEAGLRNAVERGDNLEDAVNSFINAGYNPVEVREAANNISSGATQITQLPQNQGNKGNRALNTSEEDTQTPSIDASGHSSMFDEKPAFKASKPEIDNMEGIGSKFDKAPKNLSDRRNPQISPNQNINKVAPKKNNTKIIILIALILLILMLFLFLIGVVVFKDKLIEILA